MADLSHSPQPSALHWYLRGLAAVATVPAFVLMTAYVGFAGLARDAGVPAAEAAFMTATIWALPNQVVLVGAITGGASVLAAAAAVTLTAVRLMPMIVSLMPILRDENTPRWQLYSLSHFVAVTAWVVAMTRLPHLPRPARVPFFAGFATSLTIANVLITAIAHSAIGTLPAIAAGALAFLTPIYFLVSIFEASPTWSDRAAMLFGLALGPLFYIVVPDLDLLLTGVIGGSLAYILGRLRRRRS